ncbi:MAG: SCP2 sterol-binding domain-containing protein [Planctomycetes bacterium]|nr:SCP2 sterol-binding domain-containing protein [Planctomycetota bacterium]
MNQDLRQTFEDLKRRFKPGAVEAATTFYFSLGETEGEKWSMTLTPTSCTVSNKKIDDADCVLKTSADLFMKMVAGTYKPGMSDLLSGKLKTNDPLKLQLLQEVFGL